MSCYNPFIKTDKKVGTEYHLPCGKCPDCASNRASAWSFRLMQEERSSLSAYFITLTYDTQTVPITKKGFMTLNQRDVQLFFKLLRKQHRSKIKYFYAAEYGGKTKRPHYHIILFNATLELIQPNWPHGQIHYGTVTGASVGYTLKYLQKSKWQPMHSNDDRSPEFQRMSKGIGLDYLSDNVKKWHTSALLERMYCNLTDGKKITMPRYYKNKIYDENQKDTIKEHFRVLANNTLAEWEALPDLEGRNQQRDADRLQAYRNQLSKPTQKDKT